MDLGPHADFIVAAYVVAFVVVGGLIAWVVFDYRMQKGVLADLDARGSTRGARSSTSPSANAGPA